jgi:hypothetical protein
MVAQVLLKRCGLISWCGSESKKHHLGPANAIFTGAHHIWNMNDFDYDAPAEVFACKSRGASPRPVTYRRFDSGAEALRFAIEVLPADVLFGTVVEANDNRFDAKQIRNLYDSKRYPLQRQTTR